jgi:hypothetical protein
VGCDVTCHPASHPRGMDSSATPLWDPHISHFKSPVNIFSVPICLVWYFFNIMSIQYSKRTVPVIRCFSQELEHTCCKGMADCALYCAANGNTRRYSQNIPEETNVAKSQLLSVLFILHGKG